MRYLMTLACLASLSACAGVSVSESALCRATSDGRMRLDLALVTPPTARDDFEAGEQLLAELAAGCGEDV